MHDYNEIRHQYTTIIMSTIIRRGSNTAIAVCAIGEI